MNCTACHRTYAPANSDPRGAVRIEAANYTPGVKQTIRVVVTHPEAVRWGYQITARIASDETRTAGNFSVEDVSKVICDDGSMRGVAAPCQAGQLQFAEQAAGPRTDAGAGYTFSVDWTAPPSDVGDVVFYAAANAANGDGTNAGDRIYTAVRRISAPCNLTQQPSIRSVVNGASFQTAWNAGAMLTIFGSNFAAAGGIRQVTGGDLVDRKFPQSLACVAVTVNGLNAPITYVNSGQINAQAPQLAGVGNVSVVVIANPGAANEMRSDAVSVTTQAAYAPAFFTFNGKLIASTSADGTKYLADPAVVSGSVPARPGDIVVLYATGLGPTRPAVAPGEIVAAAASTTGAVTVSVNGTAIPPGDVLYAGLVPQSISGLYQLNVRLPAALPDGDVPVVMSVAGQSSPSGTTIHVRN